MYNTVNNIQIYFSIKVGTICNTIVFKYVLLLVLHKKNNLFGFEINSFVES